VDKGGGGREAKQEAWEVRKSKRGGEDRHEGQFHNENLTASSFEVSSKFQVQLGSKRQHKIVLLSVRDNRDLSEYRNIRQFSEKYGWEDVERFPFLEGVFDLVDFRNFG
jgi:hypothetical protein